MMKSWTTVMICGVTLTSALAACGSDTGGGGGEAGGTTTTTTTSATTGTTSTTTTSTTSTTTTTSGTGGSSGVTYTNDAKPIFAKHCAPCHVTSNFGGVNFAANYADTQKAPTVPTCTGLATIGACAVARIKAGEMPLGEGCTGDPVKDAAKPACLTQAEQDTLAAWVAGGEVQ